MSGKDSQGVLSRYEKPYLKEKRLVSNPPGKFRIFK